MRDGSQLEEAWVVSAEVLGSSKGMLRASNTVSHCVDVLVHVRPSLNNIVKLSELLEALLSSHQRGTLIVFG